MRKLYEIEDDLARIIEVGADRYVDGDTGEIISKEDFEGLQMEWKDKVEGVCLGYKNETAQAEAIKAEIDKLTERMNRHKNVQKGIGNLSKWFFRGRNLKRQDAKSNRQKARCVSGMATRKVWKTI